MQRFLADGPAELEQLRADLIDRAYRPSRYRQFSVRDPKPRLISCADFRDRVVHHAICGQLAPVIERRLIDDTYACRCGKGRHRAVLRAQAFCRRYRYCLKTDIRRYYDRVDHWIKETRGALGYVRYMDAKFGRQLKTPHPTRRSARTE